MEEIDWYKFKYISETNFEDVELEECWGYQIQAGTTWNEGLSLAQINKLEERMGFEFPIDYKEMLQVINGFAIPQISLDPEGKEEPLFNRRCYQYPEDLKNVQGLILEVNDYIEYAKEALKENGFDTNDIEGFIPLYGHRALVVFKNKTLSPVLSIWGSDIIVYGKSLLEYWCEEFYLNNEFNSVK